MKKKEQSVEGIVNAFTFDSAEKVLKLSDNNVFSPVSLYCALAIMTACADGGTVKNRMLDFLHLDSEEELRCICRELIKDFGALVSGEHQKVILNNSVWISDRCDEDPAIKSITADFEAFLDKVDFTHEASPDRISQWVEDKTNGLIRPDLEFDSKTLMVIINTLYFRGVWNYFYPDETEPDDFHRADGTIVKTPFMDTAVWDNYASLDHCKVISMDLGDNCEMRYVLPDEGVLPSDLLLDKETYQKAMTVIPDRYADIRLRIPKMDIRTHIDVVTDARKLGLDRIIKDMTFDQVLHERTIMNKVIHDTRIKVDEDGVEGAAMTEIQADILGLPDFPDEKVELVFNRPFLFGIYERKTSTWLFLGVYGDPAK